MVIGFAYVFTKFISFETFREVKNIENDLPAMFLNNPNLFYGANFELGSDVHFLIVGKHSLSVRQHRCTKVYKRQAICTKTVNMYCG